MKAYYNIIMIHNASIHVSIGENIIIGGSKRSTPPLHLKTLFFQVQGIFKKNCLTIRLVPPIRIGEILDPILMMAYCTITSNTAIIQGYLIRPHSWCYHLIYILYFIFR